MSIKEISELYKRTEANSRDIAVLQKQINTHEKSCMEKHDTVIQMLDKIDRRLSAKEKWFLGVLTTLLIACVIYIIKMS